MKGPGGTDTLGVDKDNVIALAEAFSDYGVEKIYTGHCTGMPAYEILKVELPDNVNKLSAGTIFEI